MAKPGGQGAHANYQCVKGRHSFECMALLSCTPKIGNEGGVPLLLIERSDVGVALVFLRGAKI